MVESHINNNSKKNFQNSKQFMLTVSCDYVKFAYIMFVMINKSCHDVVILMLWFLNHDLQITSNQMMENTSGNASGGLLTMHFAMNSSPLTSRMKPHLENHLKAKQNNTIEYK